MKAKFIPYGRQWIDDDDIQAVVEVLKSDFLTTGPTINSFEKKLCELTGAKYAVAISNGTTALHAACYAAGIGVGDEVITTPNTFAATSNAILYCGGTPVFVDIEERTYNIDPDAIISKISPRTKAIIAVDYAGNSCNYDAIAAIAKKHNLILIEDAAHAIGTIYNGIKVGNIADLTTFSFHPVKTITTGEGGAITTNDKSMANKMRMFRHHGITRDDSLLIKNEGPWYYEQQYLGNNYRMTDIQCALGISQLNKLDMYISRRRAIFDQYNEAFKNMKQLTIPSVQLGCTPAFHLYSLCFDFNQMQIDRIQLFELYKEAGIGVNVHYIPVYKHPYYQNNGYNEVYCEHAEKFYKNEVSLPLFPKMTNEDVERVIEITNNIIKKYSK